jgi:gliding motility-associated-like protein
VANCLDPFMRIIAISLFFLLSVLSAHADHIAGGEISYRFLSKDGTNYAYRVTIRFYRDCSSLEPLEPAAVLQVSNRSFYEKIDIQQRSKGPLSYTYLPYCTVNRPSGCYEIAIYEGDITVKYSTEGYYLFVTGCCRNKTPVNILTDEASLGAEDHNGVPVPGQGYTLQAFIPPHNTTEFNTSPQPVTDSVLSICESRPFQYRFAHEDPDGDSLVYALCGSLGIMKNTLPFFTDANYASGFSGTTQVGGVPALSINPKTGLIAGTPNRTGFYTLTICIGEYRAGKIISNHRKELQIEVYQCKLQPPKDITNCESPLALFTNTNNTDNHYSWDFGVPELSSDTSSRLFPFYNYPRDGDFTVTLKAFNPATGCGDTVRSSVRILRGLVADFTWNGPICNGEDIRLQSNASTPAGNIVDYKWELVNDRKLIGTTPALTFSYPAPNTAVFPLSVQLTVTTDSGCKKSMLKVIEIHPYPQAYAGPDTVLAFNQPYTMQGSGAGAYTWSPATGLSNPNIANPVLTGNRDQTYVLKVGANDRCVDYDTVTIRYFAGPEVYVPTAFTPNGDGINDIFHFTPVSMQVRSFSIFNRWGEVLYSSTDYRRGWDGTKNNKPQPQGTYLWVAEAINSNGERVIKKGLAQLIR